MPAVTLEQLVEKQDQLADLIEKFKKQRAATHLTIDAVQIELQPGEHYAGAVLDADGKVLHHLVLMADLPDSDLGWQDAMDWAEGVGGSLPTRQEQALLYANCKAHLRPTWHWSCETHESNASDAWDCNFYDGYQHYSHKGAAGGARAVRRLNA